MKSKILLAVMAVFLVVAFASCDFAGTSLTGTKWLYEPVSGLGTGTGLTFKTATTGVSNIVLLNSWSDNTTFTYTYDSGTKRGTITFSSTAYDFSITGNEMTYSGVVYKYKP